MEDEQNGKVQAQPPSTQSQESRAKGPVTRATLKKEFGTLYVTTEGNRLLKGFGYMSDAEIRKSVERKMSVYSINRMNKQKYGIQLNLNFGFKYIFQYKYIPHNVWNILMLQSYSPFNLRFKLTKCPIFYLAILLKQSVGQLQILEGLALGHPPLHMGIAGKF